MTMLVVKDIEDILLLADSHGARLRIRSIDGRGYATWIDMRSRWILLNGLGGSSAEALANLITKIKEKYPDPEN